MRPRAVASVAALVVALVGAVVAGATGRVPQTPPTATPVLRTSVEQAVVDAVVTDANGVPVAGLTAADFEIREGDKLQTILTFSEVALPLAPRTAGAPLPPAAEIRSSLQAGDGRVYVLLLDDQFVMPARTPGVRALGREFLQR